MRGEVDIGGEDGEDYGARVADVGLDHFADEVDVVPCRGTLGGAEDSGDVDDGEVVFVWAADLDLEDVVGEDGAGCGGVVDVEAESEAGVYLGC